MGEIEVGPATVTREGGIFRPYKAIVMIHLPRAEDGTISPYMTIVGVGWSSENRYVVKWGRTPEDAARRCKDKAKKILKAHNEWKKKRDSETYYI